MLKYIERYGNKDKDPTTLICSLVNEKDKEIYIFDEFYKRNMTNPDIAKMLKHKGYNKCKIICDSAEPKSIEELKHNGISRATPAKKGKDSIMFGISKLQQYTIYVHPSCENIIAEFSNYAWDVKNGETLNKPIDDWCHCIDALRYSMEEMGTKKKARALSKSKLGIY